MYVHRRPVANADDCRIRKVCCSIAPYHWPFGVCWSGQKSLGPCGLGGGKSAHSPNRVRFVPFLTILPSRCLRSDVASVAAIFSLLCKFSSPKTGATPGRVVIICGSLFSIVHTCVAIVGSLYHSKQSLSSVLPMNHDLFPWGSRVRKA